MLSDRLPFLNKKTQTGSKKMLPGLAKGILHKESLAQTPSEVPDSLPAVPKKTQQIKHESENIVEQKSFFAENKEEVVSHAPEPRKREIEQSETQASFFVDLAKHLSTEEEMMHQRNNDLSALSNRNLVGEMKEYWSNQKSSMNILRQSKELEADVLERVEELRRLENEWQRLEHQIDECKKEMMEKERKIDDESSKLKTLMRKWTLKRDTKKEQYFRLATGQECKNMAELAYWLKKIDPQTFYTHVQPGRNDFASWTRHVFNDEQLARALESENERDKIVAVIEQALK